VVSAGSRFPAARLVKAVALASGRWQRNWMDDRPVSGRREEKA
jgi:hypothetical protein